MRGCLTGLLVFLLGAVPPLLAQAPTAATQSGAAARPQRIAEGSVPVPQFTHHDRVGQLSTAFPEIERIVAAFVAQRHIPGAVLGVIVDGELVHTTTTGMRDLVSKAPVTVDSVFRIASMTKSFTAMSILKLRDDGKLSLDDPVARYIPELTDLPYPTKDSPVLTIRHLLTHSEGFPEDNPWGDRQLAQSDETMGRWMRQGIPFSTVPGTGFEYSNYGFAMLGRIVSRASGMPYTQYLEEHILRPLGMTSTTLEMSDVPSDRIARGYRWEDDGWKDEELLAHGSFGAMGGLWTSTRDLARYVAFLMSAFPPRDDAEIGPVRRASAREMQQAWRMTPATARRPTVDAPLFLAAGGYGYGLGVQQHCTLGVAVSHGGGLPGYGSLMLWLPDYGVGVIAMGNVTYAGWGGTFQKVFGALERTGGLHPRRVQPSPALRTAKDDVSTLIVGWDDGLAARVVADNLFMDRPAGKYKAEFAELAARHGACRADGDIVAENALRGDWRMACDRGSLRVAITLAPTTPPRVQYLSVRSIMPLAPRMAEVAEEVRRLAGRWDAGHAASVAAPALDLYRAHAQLTSLGARWGGCRVGEALGGNGTSDAIVRFDCAKGPIDVSLGLDAGTGRLARLSVSAAGSNRCEP